LSRATLNIGCMNLLWSLIQKIYKGVVHIWCHVFGRGSISEILTSCFKKENRKFVSPYVDDPFKNFILNFTINSCSRYFKINKNLMIKIHMCQANSYAPIFFAK
jgi:hypothetical protein